MMLRIPKRCNVYRNTIRRKNQTPKTTTDFFEALQNLIPGSKVDPAAAKKITDYVEETKTTNVADMKEIFLTKDDKIELIGAMKQDKIEVLEKIHKSKTATILWIAGVGIIQFIPFLPS